MPFLVQCAEHCAQQRIGSQQALGMIATHLLFQLCSCASQLRPFFILLRVSDHGGMPLIDEGFNIWKLHRQQERIFEPLGRESLSNRIWT